jgi:hypothetical protein
VLQEKTPSQAGTERQPDNKSKRRMVWNALVARRGIIAYLPIIIAAALMFYGASWQMFRPHTDATRYQCYALTFWLGSRAINLLQPTQCYFITASSMSAAPLHMLPIEYPPLTLAIFSLGLLAPLAYYQVAFALWMAIAALLIFWLLQRFGPRGAALTFACYILVGAYATAEGRFDLVPAGLTLLCVIAAERRRWTIAYIFLAVAVLLKIYPILFLPALFIAEQRESGRFYTPQPIMTPRTSLRELWQTLRGMTRWQWKHCLIFLAVLIGVTGAFALLNTQGAGESQFSYFINRPMQIEASGSSLLWIATLFGLPAHTVYTFGSLNVVSPLDSAVSLLSSAAFALGCLYVIWLQWRNKLNLLQAFIALLLVFIVTGKVFSPQYLMWVLPLLAYAYPLDLLWFPAWMLISLLTSIIYPYLYTRTPQITSVYRVPGFLEIVGLRDLLLLLLTLAFLFNWWRIRERKAGVAKREASGLASSSS